jgi:hypothetical protein
VCVWGGGEAAGRRVATSEAVNSDSTKGKSL